MASSAGSAGPGGSDGPGRLTGLVRHLLAVQAQDPSAFPLALRARLPGVTAADVARARADRALVRCWGPRGTLHLIAAGDLPWLYPLVKPGPAGSVRRLRELGTVASADTVVETVDAVLLGQGPLTKTELGDRLGAKGLTVTGQGIVHAAMLAAGRGLVVLGPEQGGKPTYVHATDWLGAPLPTALPATASAAPAASASAPASVTPASVTPASATANRAAAIRTLITRYRAAHDPCEPADLAAWSALPPAELASAWQSSPAPSTPAPSATPAVDELPLRLIPAYDEYLLGWRTRDHAVPAEFRALIHPGGGIIKSVILVNGRAAGTWQLRRTPTRAVLTVTPFTSLPPATRDPLEREVADIAAFLGIPTRLTLA